jgi:hypothetical protein
MQQEPAATRRVVFLKLRKTGGTSLASSVLFPYCVRHGLSYMAPVGWWAVHPRTVPGNQFHMMFRHFPDYPQPWAQKWLKSMIGDYLSLTMLRDPIARAVSAFNDAVHYNGYRHFQEYWDTHHERNHQSRWLGYDGRDDSFLEKNFSMVGVTERFNECMLLFGRVIDLSLEEMLYVPQRRDTPKAITRADLSDAWVRKIREADWLDFELHAQATRLADYYLEDLPGLDEELPRYEAALADLSDPLWAKRGPFPIGYAPDAVWAEMTADGEVRQVGELLA